MVEDKFEFESSLVDLVLSKPVQGCDLEAVIEFCSLHGCLSYFTKDNIVEVSQVMCCNSVFVTFIFIKYT